MMFNKLTLLAAFSVAVASSDALLTNPVKTDSKGFSGYVTFCVVVLAFLSRISLEISLTSL